MKKNFFNVLGITRKIPPKREFSGGEQKNGCFGRKTTVL